MHKSQSPAEVVGNCIEQIWHFIDLMKLYLYELDIPERSAWEGELATSPAWREKLADARETLARLEGIFRMLFSSARLRCPLGR